MNTNDDTQKWLLIGGGILVAAVLALLLFNIIGQPGAAPPITPTAIGVTSPIVGPVWEWTSTIDSSGKTTTVSNPAQYTIQFQADSTYKAQADCNSINGTYNVSGSSLAINPGATTLVGCPTGSLATEYTTQLFAAASYLMQGTELTINLKADSGNMHFRQQGAPGNASVLIGPDWKWHQTQNNNNTNQVVPDPNQYVLQFSTDGRVQIKADCNSGSGVYSAGANNTLTIKIQQLTRAACPPGSLSDQYVQQLNSTVSYFTGGPDLVLNIQANSAKMMFGSGVFPTAIPPVTIVAGTPVATTAPATAANPNTPPPACPGPPIIQSFTAENPTIQVGQNTVLRWGQVLNATEVAIDQGIGGVAAPGSTIVAPGTSTNYTMTATGCGGTAQAVVTITVSQPTAPLPTAAPSQPPTQPPSSTAEPTAPPPTVQPGAELDGLWKWLGMRLQDGSSVAPPDPDQYTITFNADNTASILADCNQAPASWSVSGNQISIVIGNQTQAICGTDSLSDRYLAWLGQANTYSVEGSALLMDLAQDSGRMTLSR